MRGTDYRALDPNLAKKRIHNTEQQIYYNIIFRYLVRLSTKPNHPTKKPANKEDFCIQTLENFVNINGNEETQRLAKKGCI